MTIEVFLSHQRVDSELSKRLADRLLKLHQIECYLDVIDPYVGGPIEQLGDHIRQEMGKCMQLLAVVSAGTTQSQWVPWEVGLATEKEFPLATYAASQAPPMEFLRKWPYLRSEPDLDEYARASKAADRVQVQKRTAGVLNESLIRTVATREFYSVLRSALRQG